jgi:hypothetical protein
MASAVVSSIDSRLRDYRLRDYRLRDYRLRDYRLRALSSRPLGVVPLATQSLPMVITVSPLNSVWVRQSAVMVFPASVTMQYCPLPVLDVAVQVPPKSPNCDVAVVVRVKL